VQSYFTKENLVSLIVPVSLVVLAIAARVFGLIPNFSPIGAIALFAGTVLTGSARWWVPFIGLIVSDIIMASTNTYGLTFWQYLSASPFVYLAFAGVILLGSLNKNRTAITVAASVVGTSLSFFIVTNFFVWLNPLPVWPGMYPATWDGLIACYVAAIPFFQNTLTSDVLYSAILFGSYSLATRPLREHSKQSL